MSAAETSTEQPEVIGPYLPEQIGPEMRIALGGLSAEYALARMRPRYRRYLEERFNLLGGDQQYTKAEMGRRWSVTGARAGVIEFSALDKIRLLRARIRPEQAMYWDFGSYWNPPTWSPHPQTWSQKNNWETMEDL